MAKLFKPCPFCGSYHVNLIEAKNDSGSWDGFKMFCSNCWIEQGYIYPTELDAVKAWNARTQPIIYCGDCEYYENPKCMGRKPYETCNLARPAFRFFEVDE